jgi:hypothetical protein
MMDPERRLLSALRAIPTDGLRARVMDVAEALAEKVRDPHCAEMQADGVPCQDTEKACEECQGVTALLGEIELLVRG